MSKRCSVIQTGCESLLIFIRLDLFDLPHTHMSPSISGANSIVLPDLFFPIGLELPWTSGVLPGLCLASVRFEQGTRGERLPFLAMRKVGR